MEYFVFYVRLSDDCDKQTIKDNWPGMVRRAKPENRVTAHNADAAILKFAELTDRYGTYRDYVAGTADAVELASHVKVEYVPKATTVCRIDM